MATAMVENYYIYPRIIKVKIVPESSVDKSINNETKCLVFMYIYGFI